MKNRSRDLATPPFDPFFISSISLTFNPHAEFQVCTFSRARDIRGVSKFKK